MLILTAVPLPPIAESPPPVITPTSRVRKWTRAQRRCDRRIEGKCVMGVPDMVTADVKSKRMP